MAKVCLHEERAAKDGFGGNDPNHEGAMPFGFQPASRRLNQAMIGFCLTGGRGLSDEELARAAASRAKKVPTNGHAVVIRRRPSGEETRHEIVVNG
ncbi:MAG: hypothetical protein AAB817_00450 [Patescibacteria group bacterium]